MKKKKIARVVLGVGYPWYYGQGPGGSYSEIRLYKKKLHESLLFRTHDTKNLAGISPSGTGNWNKIRLVAEIISG